MPEAPKQCGQLDIDPNLQNCGLKQTFPLYKLSQVFCYSNWKLMNMVMLPLHHFVGGITAYIMQSGENNVTE